MTTDDALRHRMSALSDAELRKMVTSDSESYRPEALAMANEALVRRDLDLGFQLDPDPRESQEPDPEEHKQ